VRAQAPREPQFEVASIKPNTTGEVNVTLGFAQRESPVYALVRDKGDRLGPQLRPAAADCPKLLAAARSGTPLPASARILCGSRVGSGTLAIGGLTMDQIASSFWPLVGRIVVNRTGFEGSFDLDLNFAPEGSQPGTATSSDQPSTFTAVQEQLGLRLDAVRAPIDVLAVERVERPTSD
jgi:uncharacterized protein (TIGR03435 family)